MKDSMKGVTGRITLLLMTIGSTISTMVAAHDGHAHSAPNQTPPTATVSRPPERSRFQSEYVAPAVLAPHRGQMFKANAQLLEVVYLPRETRIYLYDSTGSPLSARVASGEVIMQVVGNPEYFRNPLRYVAQAQGSPEQDYLAAQVDVTKIRDGDMRVYFDLLNLPAPKERSVRFNQVFALTNDSLVVAVVPLTEVDRPAVARQATCPVMQTGFDHGEPIKLMVGKQVIYVCCEDCIETIKSNPQAYLARVVTYNEPRREAQRVPESPSGISSKCSKGCCK